jgi:hypothetical protein
MSCRWVGIVLALALVAAATAAGPAASGPQAAAGALDLQVNFSLVSNPFACPPDVLPPGSVTDRDRVPRTHQHRIRPRARDGLPDLHLAARGGAADLRR